MKKLAILAVLLMLPVFAAADSIEIRPTGNPVSITGPDGSGYYLWTYQIFLTSDNGLNSTSQFTFFDVGGYITGSAAYDSSSPEASGAAVGQSWSAGESLTGPGYTTGSTTLTPTDSASLWNVTFSYTGNTFSTGVSTDLGYFSFLSEYNVATTQSFAGKYLDPAGNLAINGRTYTAPIEGEREVPAVPEPATLLLMASGLSGLALRRRKAAK